MIDHTWELVGLLTCGLIVAVWALFAWSRWYVRRRRRDMATFVRQWDSMQDHRRRVAERGANQVWNGHE